MYIQDCIYSIFLLNFTNISFYILKILLQIYQKNYENIYFMLNFIFKYDRIFFKYEFILK